MLPLPPYYAGVDEVGRGPLAGPVIAAAVMLDPCRPISGLRDSKRLTAKQRAELAEEIRTKALAWSLGRAEVAEIDTLNILQAIFLAMQRAVEQLLVVPKMIAVDGCHVPPWKYSSHAIVKGDQSYAVIAAASIIAKVARDTEMEQWHAQYPHYRFHQHKGYPTQEHLALLRQYGASPIHRRSFKPVGEVLKGVLC